METNGGIAGLKEIPCNKGFIERPGKVSYNANKGESWYSYSGSKDSRKTDRAESVSEAKI